MRARWQIGVALLLCAAAVCGAQVRDGDDGDDSGGEQISGQRLAELSRDLDGLDLDGFLAAAKGWRRPQVVRWRTKNVRRTRNVYRTRVVHRTRNIVRRRKRFVNRVLTRNRVVSKTVTVRGKPYWRARTAAILRRVGGSKYRRCVRVATRARRSRVHCLRAGVSRLRSLYRNSKYVKCLAGVKALAGSSLLQVSQGEVEESPEMTEGADENEHVDGADPNDAEGDEGEEDNGSFLSSSDSDSDSDSDASPSSLVVAYDPNNMEAGGSADTLVSMGKGWRVRPRIVHRVRHRIITVPKVINRNVIKFRNVYRTQHVPVVRTTYRTRVIRRTIRKQAAIARAEIENDIKHVNLCKRLGAGRATPRVVRQIAAVKRKERSAHVAHLRAIAAMMRARAQALRTRAAQLRARRAERRVVQERRVIEKHYVPNRKHITTNHHLDTSHTQNVHVHLGGPNLDELRRDVRDATRGVLEDFYASLARKREARRAGRSARPPVP